MTSRPARILRWAGGLLAGSILAAGGLSLADALAQHDTGGPVLTFAVPRTLVLDVRGDLSLSVDPAAGDVTAMPGGQAGLNTPELRPAILGTRLTLRYACPALFPGSCDASLGVVIPPGVAVEIDSPSADAYVFGSVPQRAPATGSVRDLRAGDARRAPLTYRSRTGSLDLSYWRGSVTATSEGGAINADVVEGGLVARAGAGVIASDVTGACEVAAGSGPVELAEMGGTISATTSSGDITITSPQDGTDVRLTATSATGHVQVTGPTSATAQRVVTARTQSGDITYRPPDAPARAGGHGSAER